jgi:hypothetical protein
MRRAIYILAFIILAQAGLMAQTKPPIRHFPCSTLKVECPSELPSADQLLTFTARVEYADPNAKLSYEWTISSGTLTSGQNTSTIVVKQNGFGSSVTATVKVGGVAPECHNIASCTFMPESPPISRRFDQYGKLSLEYERARLDNFVIELQNNPGAQGYVIAYEGQRSRARTASARLKRIKDYLINKRGIDVGRIVAVEGDLRLKTETELWIVPTGADPPKATPAIEP